MSNCFCTHANTSHGRVNCAGYIPSAKNAVMCATCSAFADQHHCSDCDCREFWDNEMNRIHNFGRRPGPVKRDADGVGRVV